MTDQIDVLAGLVPQSDLYMTRRNRPDFVGGMEECRAAVLSPDDDLGIGLDLRAALAARMARMIGNQALAETYDRRIGEENAVELRGIACGTPVSAGCEPFIAAMLAHLDLVTLDPGKAGEGDISRLHDGGLQAPQIVALSELIAFVNFEGRVIAGLMALAERK